MEHRPCRQPLVGFVLFLLFLLGAQTVYLSPRKWELNSSLSSDPKDPSTSSAESDDAVIASGPYQPSPVEAYVLSNVSPLGYDKEGTSGCALYQNDNPWSTDLEALTNEIETYHRKLNTFQLPFTDLRKQMRLQPNNHKALCQALELPGMSDIQSSFPHSKHQLSYLPGMGYMEPLLPPLRNAKMCMPPNFDSLHRSKQMDVLMRMDYMVHDFGALCRSGRLKPHSRLILIDMGASLAFHDNAGIDSPALFITSLYAKMGLAFDHIYAFEITPQSPADVYDNRLPPSLIPSYHWINVGVSADPLNDRRNPLASIVSRYEPDDWIVVKLDIDTASLEVPLAESILANYADLVDALYFEHHVRFKELLPFWRDSAKGTLNDTLTLFTALREKGVAAHYWP